MQIILKSWALAALLSVLVSARPHQQQTPIVRKEW
jgi:hypothetical protein